MESRNPPVQLGDKVEVEVEGEGKKPNTVVAKKDGYVIFVQECTAKEHEKIYVEMTAALPRYGFAKVVKVEDTEDFGEDEQPEQEDKQPEQTE